MLSDMLTAAEATLTHDSLATSSATEQEQPWVIR